MTSVQNVQVKNQKIRFALVGCGRISKNHLISLEKFKEETQLVAACDIEPEALERVTREFSVAGFNNLDALMSFGDFDVAILCTPSGLHASQAIKLLQAGHHVITEKPMATRWQDGLEMLVAADKAQRQLFVVKQNRLNPTLQMVKEAITLNRFGKIHMVTVNVFWTRPQEYYDQAPWRGTWKLDGGAFMNQASHYVDLLNWLVGPIAELQAFTGTLARRIEAEDTGCVSFRLNSGGMGSMNVTMLTYPKNLEGSITLIGENGTARIGGLAVNEIQHWEFKEPHPMDNKLKEASYDTTCIYGIGHPLYYKNVISVLNGQGVAISDGREGLKSLEILTAIYDSAKDQKLVRLPLERA